MNSKIREMSEYCLSCKNKPCSQKGCPLNNDIPTFIRYIKEENYEEAYKTLTKTTVLPAICGRICPHYKQCMGSCIRGIKGEPVSIGELEAFIGDMAIKNNYKLEKQNIENKKIAIVGRSGNGKSTLFNLLLRYFDTTEGNILIDGIDIKDLTEASLRNNISIIRQTPFLFNMSILDNFKIVKPNTTLKEIREVCKKAYIDDYIMSLPNKYKTIIGEGGVNLSGGQKQRLAIARTLLLDTKIILFDEATSALDNESQEYIKKTIDNLIKDHTVIIVAHRLSTIVDADIINVIDQGKLDSSGKHEELLKNSKVYQKLYTIDSNS